MNMNIFTIMNQEITHKQLSLSNLCAVSIINSIVNGKPITHELNENMHLVLSRIHCSLCNDFICRELYHNHCHAIYHVIHANVKHYTDRISLEHNTTHKVLILCNKCYEDNLHVNEDVFYDCRICGNLNCYPESDVCGECYKYYTGGNPISNLLHFSKIALETGNNKHILYDNIGGPIIHLWDPTPSIGTDIPVDVEFCMINNIDDIIEDYKSRTFEEILDVERIYAHITVLEKICHNTYLYKLECYNTPQLMLCLKNYMEILCIDVVFQITFDDEGNILVFKTINNISSEFPINVNCYRDNYARELRALSLQDLLEKYLLKPIKIDSVLRMWPTKEFDNYCVEYHKVINKKYRKYVRKN